MLKNTYFSSGEYCATAHQIRRCTKNVEPYFFDWLVTRENSFDFIGRASNEFLHSMNWEIVDGGIRLMDRYSRLLFQHEFKTVVGEGIDKSLVENHLLVAREKFLYLKEKLIAALVVSNRGVILRSENGIKSTDQAMQRLYQLQKTFLPFNPNLKFVIASTDLYQCEYFSSDYIFIQMDKPLQPNGQDAWKGNDYSWDRLFEVAESNFIF